VVANRHVLRSDRAYYLMIPERRVESTTLDAFREWLVAQAADYTDTKES